MDLIEIGTGSEKVWVNPAQIAWFWNYEGRLHIKFVGSDDMQSFPGITAAEFERKLNPITV